KKILMPIHNPILLNTENNGPFPSFSVVLQSSHKPTKPYYTFACLSGLWSLALVSFSLPLLG
ncbi:unnamed protein product, partial [Sphagnum jensenii]